MQAPKPAISESVIVRPPIKKVTGHGVFSTPSILDALKDDPKSETTRIVSENSGNQYIGKETKTR